MDVFGLIPRAGALVFALILIAVSAATIGIINDNDILVAVRDHEGNPKLSEELQELQLLIRATQTAALWIIIMGIVLVIAESIGLGLVILNLQSTVKLAFGALGIIFSLLTMLALLVTGIVCALYAAAWGRPLEVCEPSSNGGEDVCDNDKLTATNALEAVFCFIELVLLGSVITATVFGLKRNASSTPTTAAVENY